MLGLTPKMISFYELGGRYPPHDILTKLAAIFNVSSDYLLGISSKSTPQDAKKETPINDEDLKFALWGPAKDEITEEELADVRAFAQFIAERKKRQQGKRKNESE